MFAEGANAFCFGHVNLEAYGTSGDKRTRTALQTYISRICPRQVKLGRRGKGAQSKDLATATCKRGSGGNALKETKEWPGR